MLEMDLNSQFFQSIQVMVEPGNTIITDGWFSYNFLDEMAEYTQDNMGVEIFTSE